MNRKKLLASLNVAEPCSESWDEMQGDARSRHCASCDKDVHNLATMSPKAIEELIIQTGGKFCGRVTRRSDGSLVTLHTGRSPRSIAPLAAGIAATAVMTVSATNVRAQSSIQADQASQAILTGTVIQPNDKTVVPHAIVILSISGKDYQMVHANASGVFRVELPPGTYDVSISENLAFPRTIYRAKLHSGEQSLGDIQLRERVYTTVTGGAIAVPVDARLKTIFRHPVGYLKYLARKL